MKKKIKGGHECTQGVEIFIIGKRESTGRGRGIWESEE